MSALAERFEKLKEKGEKALVLFVTAGDPSLDDLPAILRALQEGGADAVEIGIPFSDPIADGPTIQASSQRALDRGVTPTKVLDVLKKAQVDIPLVLMGYLNPILRRGYAEFSTAAVEAGASGVIVSDLTPEESDDWVAASRKARLDTIFLAAPTSTDKRLEEVAKRTTGFVYAVARTGVTGASEELPTEVPELVGRIRQHTPAPVCVGFGISKPAHVRTLCEVADGVVIGSWLVNLLESNWRDGKGRDCLVEKVREMKAATRP